MKPASPIIPKSKKKERIHKLLRNIVRTYNIQEKYIDDAELWIGILVAATFTVHPTYHRIKDKSLGQLVFGLKMILMIKYVVNWRYTHQGKQAKIEKYPIRKNSTRIEYEYRVRYWSNLSNKSAYEYKNRFKDM